MKKILSILVLSAFAMVFAAQPAYAMTTQEILAKIAQLQAQLNSLQTQLNSRSTTTAGTSASSSANPLSWGFALTSQKTSETWQKSTRQHVTWVAPSAAKGKNVNIYLSPVASSSDYLIAKDVAVKKGEAKIALVKLSKAPLGIYRVKVTTTNNKVSTLLAVSSSTVTVAEAPDPSIQVTAPQAGTQWDQGKHRVTWTANFVRTQVKNHNANGYAGIRIVPKYGIGTDARSLDLSKFSESDRKILLALKPSDVLALAKMTDEELSDIDPLLRNLPVSPLGLDMLSKMSDDGLDKMKDIDFLGIGEFTQDAMLKPIQELAKIDPIFKAFVDNDPLFGGALGGLFGDDEDEEVPEKVNILIEAVPVAGGSPIKLAKTYLEKSRHTVSLKKLTIGKQYKIRLTVQLPKKVLSRLQLATITAESGVFTVVAKQTGKPVATSTPLVPYIRPFEPHATGTPLVPYLRPETATRTCAVLGTCELRNVEKAYADFGGAYSTSFANAITGSNSCPTGFTAAKVLGTTGVDADVFYCFKSPTTDESEIKYDFGGIYGKDGTTAGLKNPITRTLGCPSGYTEAQFKGQSSLDFAAYFCYRSHIIGRAGAAEFGGMYGYGKNTTYGNAFNNQIALCKSGYTPSRFSGKSGTDFNASFCYIKNAVSDSPAAILDADALAPIVNGLEALVEKLTQFVNEE